MRIVFLGPVECCANCRVIKLGHPATQLDSMSSGELMDDLPGAIEKTRPETVFLPQPGDIHTDHRGVCTAVFGVPRPPWRQHVGVRRGAGAPHLVGLIREPS